MEKQLKSQKGMALMEVVIAAGIMMVVTMAMVSTMQNQAQETRALNEKINALELQRSLTQSLSDTSVCQTMMAATTQKITAGSITPATALSFNRIPASAASAAAPLVTIATPVSSSAPTLEVNKISYKSITPTGAPDTYDGTLVVEYDATKLVRPIRSFEMKFAVRTDATGSVTNCMRGGAVGGSPAGTCQLLTKPFIRPGPSAYPWSNMVLTCPQDFPVAMSGSTTPSAYSAGWNTVYQTTNGKYYDSVMCLNMFLEDAPGKEADVIIRSAEPGGYKVLREGVCSTNCCAL